MFLEIVIHVIEREGCLILYLMSEVSNRDKWAPFQPFLQWVINPPPENEETLCSWPHVPIYRLNLHKY